MKLILRNIGLVAESQIEISGLTLIVGNNGVGKSTVSRALYATMRSFYRLHEKTVDFKRKVVIGKLMDAAIGTPTEALFEQYRNATKAASLCAHQLFSLDSISPSNTEITEGVNQFATKFSLSDATVTNLVQQIKEVSDFSEVEVYKRIVDAQLSRTFSGQISNLYHEPKESAISLLIKNKEIAINIKDNHVESLINPTIIRYEPFYISNFADLVNGRSNSFLDANSLNHNKIAREYIYNEAADPNLVLHDKTKYIINRLNKITKGKLIQDDSDDFWFVSEDAPNVKIHPNNLASGLKTFLVLLDLLEKNLIVDNATLILDEPEVHLHPEWQVYLAELLVLIQKAYNLHLLISTHSPYFFSAIDVYSKKHEIRETTKFYTMNKNDSSVDILDISNDLSVAYNDLTRPFQIIEDTEN